MNPCFQINHQNVEKYINIANSVIILDEAQMLPMDYLIPCTAMLQELVQNYKTSVVLCTATQPSLDNFFWTYKKNLLNYVREWKNNLNFLNE